MLRSNAFGWRTPKSHKATLWNLKHATIHVTKPLARLNRIPWAEDQALKSPALTGTRIRLATMATPAILLSLKKPERGANL